MQQHPLEFVRSAQQLRWNNGTRLSIPGTWVDKGTSPIGSTWCAPRPPPSPPPRPAATAQEPR